MTMERFDVTIIGGSFAGLTLARHLPRNLRVLVAEAKPQPETSVESTGLITNRTREEFSSFLEIDRYVTNPIRTIGVFAPNYEDRFFSSTAQPWIHQTDTKALVKALAEGLPPNVTLMNAAAFAEAAPVQDGYRIKLIGGGKSFEIETRFLVGADGARSRVAQAVPGLDRNEKFLFGYEQVFFGKVKAGPNPEETIYHFWFGEFSLGYGGWLSPTVVDGRPAFRLGLAKLMTDRGDAKELTEKFVERLIAEGIIVIDGDKAKPAYVFGSLIPIGGSLKRIRSGRTLLIGNAAGFCGAFAADGIKGAVVSAKEAAPLIARFLGGEAKALDGFVAAVNRHDWLLEYYRRQVRYRKIWDMMKSDRAFDALYRIIEKEKETFLEQFCDSKDKRRNLTRTVLKFKHLPGLVRFSFRLFLDCFR